MTFLINNNLFLYSTLIFTVSLIYYVRRDLLSLVFIGLSFFLFQLIPLIVIFFERKDVIYARQSIYFSGIFLLGYILSYFIFKPKRASLSHIFINNMAFIKKYSSISAYLVITGIILKIIGGDIVHSSIIKIPWSFSFLYGISDRIYYFGVMLTVINLYFFGFKGKDKIILITIIMLGFFGGSRITILLPLSFLLMLHISLNGGKAMLKMGLVGFVILIFIIVAVGLFRIDSEDRIFSYEDLLDLFLFRISEFYWPMALIEKISDGLVAMKPFWIFSGFWGIFPSSVSEIITGQSVFSRDTDTMLNSGLGSIYMSVPMTPIGEGFYWLGQFGVGLIGFVFGLGFALVNLLLKKMRPLISILVIIQLYRLSFTLPVAAYAEFISFISKDIVISIILSYIIVRIYSHKTNHGNI